MWRISLLPEGFESDAAQRVDESLLIRAQRAIYLDDAFDRAGNFGFRHRGTDDLAERGEPIGRATEGDLVPLLTVFIDAQDSDVTDVMMATGVHAAGHLDLDLAEVV